MMFIMEMSESRRQICLIRNESFTIVRNTAFSIEIGLSIDVLDYRYELRLEFPHKL